MDLRTFFGDWNEGQTILVRQGQKHYFTKLERFTSDEVLLKSPTQGAEDSFLFGIKSQSNGSEQATYTLSLEPGSGITPSFYNGENLKGMILLSSPMPSTLIVGGEYSFTSNTLFMRVIGKMSMGRKHSNPEQSNLVVNMEHQSSNIQTYEFIGEA